MLVAPFFGAIVDRVGHRNMIVIGILFMTLSMASFGTIKYLKTNTEILTVSLILRCCQGK